MVFLVHTIDTNHILSLVSNFGGEAHVSVVVLNVVDVTDTMHGSKRINR